MHKCDICGFYMRKPHKIGRKDLATKEHIIYILCDNCMYTNKSSLEEKFSYIHEKLNYREGFQISSSRHRPKEKK